MQTITNDFSCLQFTRNLIYNTG